MNPDRGKSKKIPLMLTNEQILKLSTKFKILSEPSRLKILRSLFDGEKCVTEIINHTGLMQANVSKQLKLLENEGIVSCRPNGLLRFYKITDKTVINICSQMCNSK